MFKSKQEDKSEKDALPPPALPPHLPFDEFPPAGNMPLFSERPRYLNAHEMEVREPKASQELVLYETADLYARCPDEPDRPEQEEEEEDIFSRESREAYIKMKRQSERNRLSKALEKAKWPYEDTIPLQGDKTVSGYITFV